MTSQLVKHFEVTVAGETLVLLPSRVVWWRTHQTLFIADMHLGKASAFRRAGLPVPAGTTEKVLARLTEQIRATSASTLVVLGDLTHSSTRSSNDYEEEFRRWRRKIPIRLILVKGNHDVLPSSFYTQLDIECPASDYLNSVPFELCHDPMDARIDRFALCGHLHPAINVGSQKLLCFWLRRNQLVLPAFGEFTGSSRINPQDSDQVIAAVDDWLAVVEPRS